MSGHAGDPGPAAAYAVQSLESAPPAALTVIAHQYLQQTRPWVRLMSVVTFIGAGLMAVVAGVMLLVGVMGGFAARNGAPSAMGGAVIGVLTSVFYLVMAAIYVPPAIYLWKYASAIKRLQATADAATLEAALGHQKSFWKFAGICTAIGLAVGLVVFALAIVGGIVAGYMAARR
jgi:hypothetical protein